MNSEDDRKRIIFDLDGVLLDSEADLAWLDEALINALKELQVEATQENLKKLYPGHLHDFRQAVGNFPVSPEEVWRVRDKHYVKKKVEMIENGAMKPFSDVYLLRELQESYILGIISNSPQVVVDSFVNRYKLADMFAGWVGRGQEIDDVEKIKPDPFLYRKLVDNIGEGPAWYVGDRGLDRLFADICGMKFIFLSRGEVGTKDLSQLVDRFLALYSQRS